MLYSKLLVISLSLVTLSAKACDLCGCYTPQLDATAPQSKFGLYAGVAEQFTHFGTDRFNGNEVTNPTGEYLNSTITQVVIGASLPFWHNRFGLQVSLPFIDRDFKRPDGFAIDRGNIFGLGDVALTANAIALEKTSTPASAFSYVVNLTSGIKFPTGDTSRLKENYHEAEIPGAPDSGIGGHDLTLGTGSFDAIFGLQTLVSYRWCFLQADAQFTYRTRGDYLYRFANDLSWSGGPGVYFWQREGKSAGLQCVCSGETKGYDAFQGEADRDTGITAVYLGPRIVATLGRFAGELGVDVPVVMNTTQFQTAPSWRIRGGFSWRF